MERAATITNYLSLVKFSHTVFALPFALIGFFLATTYTAESISWKLLVLVILCMVFARSAAMAFNRYADKEIDKQNPRTAVREIPKGVISENAALIFVIINCILFITTTYFINPICFYLSPVALAVVLSYSYTKRFTSLCHLVLGLGLSLAPIGAFLAVAGEFHIIPIYFSLAVLFWASGFDIIYSLQDEDFDKQKNLKSIPAALGKKNALMFSNVLHSISALFIIIAGLHAKFSFLYWIGAIIFIGILIYQHTLVKPNDLRKVNLAFFTMNGIASLVFAVFVIGDLIVY